MKFIIMNTAELKLKLHLEIETLENSQLEQVYGVVLNFLNQDNDTEEWNALSTTQQKGLLNAIEEMNSWEGIEHKEIMEKYKNKYA